MKRAEEILRAEGVTYQPPVLAQVIVKHYPDWRRVLNELQRYASQNNNTIDSGILAHLADVTIKDLITFIRDKNFTAARKWIGENDGIDQAVVFRQLYDQAAELLQPASIPTLVLILGKYQFQAAFSVDTQINLAACIAEVMVEVVFK
jgi:DNA polymerase III delta prime subunit